MLRLICPGCDKTLAVPDARAGTEATCPACRERFLVPAAPPPPAPPSPPVRPAPARLRVVEAPAESRRVDDAVDDEPEERVRRPRSSGRRRKRSRKEEHDPTPWYLGFLGVLLGLGVLTALVFVLSLILSAAALLLVFGGWALAFAGSIWFIVEVFREDQTEGLMCMLVPFYPFYYTVTHFAVVKRPLLTNLVGVGIMMLGVLVISQRGLDLTVGNGVGFRYIPAK